MPRSNSAIEAEKIRSCFAAYLAQQRARLQYLLESQVLRRAAIDAAEPENLPAEPTTSQHFDDESESEIDVPSPSYSPHAPLRRPPLILKLKKKRTNGSRAKRSTPQKATRRKQNRWKVLKKDDQKPKKK